VLKLALRRRTARSCGEDRVGAIPLFIQNGQANGIQRNCSDVAWLSLCRVELLDQLLDGVPPSPTTSGAHAPRGHDGVVHQQPVIASWANFSTMIDEPSSGRLERCRHLFTSREIGSRRT
jgi:hypothetical protein